MTKKQLQRGKERYRRECAQYIQEGWIREVYDLGWGMICAISESTYVIFLYGIIDSARDLTVLFHLKGEEVWKLLEDPSLYNFKCLNYVTQQQKDNRGYVMTPELAEKFRALYNSWGPENPPEIDRAAETARLEEAIKKLSSFRSRFARNARNAMEELFGG